MSNFMTTISGMFSGKARDEQSRQVAQQAATAKAEADQERNLQRVAQSRAEQTAMDESRRVSGAVRAARTPRGSRLLVSGESGGLATKLGAAA